MLFIRTPFQWYKKVFTQNYGKLYQLPHKNLGNFKKSKYCIFQNGVTLTWFISFVEGHQGSLSWKFCEMIHQ